MAKGKPRHNPDKPQNKMGTWCRHAEAIPSFPKEGQEVYIYCELGYNAQFCKGNPHKCKKTQYRDAATRSDRRKIIDGAY